MQETSNSCRMTCQCPWLRPISKCRHGLQHFRRSPYAGLGHRTTCRCQVRGTRGVPVPRSRASARLRGRTQASAWMHGTVCGYVSCAGGRSGILRCRIGPAEVNVGQAWRGRFAFQPGCPAQCVQPVLDRFVFLLALRDNQQPVCRFIRNSAIAAVVYPRLGAATQVRKSIKGPKSAIPSPFTIRSHTR